MEAMGGHGRPWEAIWAISRSHGAKSCDAAPRLAHFPLHVGRGVREEPAYTLTVTLTVS